VAVHYHVAFRQASQGGKAEANKKEQRKRLRKGTRGKKTRRHEANKKNAEAHSNTGHHRTRGTQGAPRHLIGQRHKDLQVRRVHTCAVATFACTKNKRGNEEKEGPKRNNKKANSTATTLQSQEKHIQQHSNGGRLQASFVRGACCLIMSRVPMASCICESHVLVQVRGYGHAGEHPNRTVVLASTLVIDGYAYACPLTSMTLTHLRLHRFSGLNSCAGGSMF